MDTIVVGSDENGGSAAAVRWAAAEADRRGWTLQLLRARQLPGTSTVGVGAWDPEDLLGDLDVHAGQELEDARTTVSAEFPGLSVSTRVVHTHPQLALTDASETARMVVTGARHRRALVGALLGSTSTYVAAHAHCPVAVVHAPRGPAASGVVVGYDGSAAAEAALAFAAEEADVLHEELLIVHAWFLGAVFAGEVDAGRYLTRSGRQQAEQRDRLEELAVGVRDRRPGSVVRTELLTHGFPSDGLVAAATGARLLVVGSRGHGAFASMLLGSTSRNVLNHAHTPVVVVPDRVRSSRDHRERQRRISPAS